MIPKKDSRSGEPWTDGELARLGTDTDRVVARMIGRTAKAVEGKRLELGVAPLTPHRRQWKKSEERLLGTVADATLAKRLGVSRKCVLFARRNRGIAPFSPKNTPKKFRKRRK